MSTQYKSNLEYLKNYLVVAERVKEIVKLLDPSAKIYVFGSVVRGLYTASSDIDILIITENVNLKYDIMVAVYRELIDAPIQLHVVTPELYERWYKRFIKPGEIIEV
ncbi:MAG: nucleotidyltransferase domain-containing protein [Thermosphaera sp.]|nr:nucleotidyltransferase domain-containing protein [Thermosphaera sp.]